MSRSDITPMADPASTYILHQTMGDSPPMSRTQPKTNRVGTLRSTTEDLTDQIGHFPLNVCV